MVYGLACVVALPSAMLLSCPADGRLGAAQVFNAIVDEFGSTLNSTVEDSCMNSIISYMNVAKGTGSHAPFTSWFYW